MSQKTQRVSSGFSCSCRAMNEEGVAIVTTLLMLTLLALLVPIIARKTTDDAKRTGAFKDSRTAFYIAEAGMEQAKALLKSQSFNSSLSGPDGNTATTNDNGTFTIAGGSIVTVSSKQYTRVAYNGGTYSVRFYDNNDGDSNLAVDVDGVGYIESIGVYKNSTKTLLAMVTKKAGGISSLPAAMTMVGGLPHAQVDGQGSGWLVSGNAVDLSGNDDPTCADTYGMATSDSNPSLSWGGNAEGSVQGTGFVAAHGGVAATPSILRNQSGFTLAQAQALYAQVVGSATNVGSGSFNGTLTWGTDASPRVTRISGEAHIGGNVSGSGILIIDGDTELTGSLDFHGLILVGVQAGANQAQLSGTGSGTILGALVMGNFNQSQAQLTGNGDIEYSCAGLSLANNLLGSNTLGVASWKEVN